MCLVEITFFDKDIVTAYLGVPLVAGPLAATVALRDKLAELFTGIPGLAVDWLGRLGAPRIEWLEPGTEFMVGNIRGEV